MLASLMKKIRRRLIFKHITAPITKCMTGEAFVNVIKIIKGRGIRNDLILPDLLGC